VNIEEEHVVTEALRSNLDSASQQINISTLFSIFTLAPSFHFDFPPYLENYRALSVKGQIYKGCPQETHILEDELTEVNVLNKILLA
jgi:hypothetical protein